MAAQLSEIGSILFIKAHGQELPLSSLGWKVGSRELSWLGGAEKREV